MSRNPSIQLLDGSLRANLVDVASQRIFSAELCWRDGTITAITELGAEKAGSPYLLPGFVDAHVHVESSMLTPPNSLGSRFAMAPLRR